MAVIATLGNNRCFFSDLYKTHKYSVWVERTIAERYTGGTHSDRWDLEVLISVIQDSQLMLYRERIAAFSQILTKHMSVVLDERRSVEC
jgi:hypothetical protein